jgi:xanthine/uracil permease
MRTDAPSRVPNEGGATMAQDRNERSLGDLFSTLTRETSTLLRQEVQLAKAELTQSATEAARGIGMLAAGGAVAYAGLLFVLLAVVFGLIKVGWDAWLAALIVGLVVVAIGAVLVLRARESLKPANLAPQQTVETLKEDAEWAKEQIP